MFLPRTALCVLESYSAVFSTARRSGLFLLIRGFPCSIDEAPPKAGCPAGSRLQAAGPCPVPRRGAHEHLSPEHPAGSSPKRAHVGFASRINQHRSLARASLLPLPRLGSRMFTCPDKWQLEAMPLPCRRREASWVRAHGRSRLCWGF